MLVLRCQFSDFNLKSDCLMPIFMNFFIFSLFWTLCPN